MAGFGRRVLTRCLPVGLISATIGYFFSGFYATIAKMQGAEIEGGSSPWTGAFNLGLIGFLLSLGIESLMRLMRPTEQPKKFIVIPPVQPPAIHE
jgi:hypothetical protein